LIRIKEKVGWGDNRVNIHGSVKWMQIMVGKSLKLLCFKNILLSTAEINKNHG
jgi:hypothetical protein